MDQSRETLQDRIKRIQDRNQQELLRDIVDSAWSWKGKDSAVATTDRWITVGGQTVRGTTAQEKAPETTGGQTDAQGQTTGAKGDKGDPGAPGKDGAPGADGAPGSPGTTLHAELTDLLGPGPEYTHLNAAQTLALTGGGDTNLHWHSADRARANHTGTQASATISDKGLAGGLATLDAGGRVPMNQLPATAIVTTSVVASQSAMLALTAEQGDVAVRTDLSKTFILKAEPASTLANWQELLSPSDGVQSVAMTATGPISVTGSPITNIGTFALTWSGSSSNLVRADGSVVASSSFQPAGSYQPLDSDLTAIAALTTTAFGRSLLTVADAVAARTAIGAQAAGSYQPLDADLTAISALATTGFVRRTAADAWAASALVWSDISGIIYYGTTAGTVAQGNDSRILNGQTAYGWGNHASAGYALASSVPAASSTTPASLGTAAVGTGATWARADHVHAMPTAVQVGALAAGAQAADSAKLGGQLPSYYATTASLGDYLPRAGGTLTGPLVGTTGSFGCATAQSWPLNTSYAYFGKTPTNGWNSFTGFACDGANTFIGGTSYVNIQVPGVGTSAIVVSSSAVTLALPLSGASADFSNRVSASLDVNITEVNAYNAGPFVSLRKTVAGVGATNYAAGYGFHNPGANGAFLYCDPGSDTVLLKYITHIGTTRTLWDSGNLTPGDYLARVNSWNYNTGSQLFSATTTISNSSGMLNSSVAHTYTGDFPFFNNAPGFSVTHSRPNGTVSSGSLGMFAEIKKDGSFRGDIAYALNGMWVSALGIERALSPSLVSRVNHYFNGFLYIPSLDGMYTIGNGSSTTSGFSIKRGEGAAGHVLSRDLGLVTLGNAVNSTVVTGYEVRINGKTSIGSVIIDNVSNVVKLRSVRYVVTIHSTDTVTMNLGYNELCNSGTSLAYFPTAETGDVVIAMGRTTGSRSQTNIQASSAIIAKNGTTLANANVPYALTGTKSFIRAEHGAWQEI